MEETAACTAGRARGGPVQAERPGGGIPENPGGAEDASRRPGGRGELPEKFTLISGARQKTFEI